MMKDQFDEIFDKGNKKYAGARGGCTKNNHYFRVKCKYGTHSLCKYFKEEKDALEFYRKWLDEDCDNRYRSVYVEHEGDLYCKSLTTKAFWIISSVDSDLLDNRSWNMDNAGYITRSARNRDDAGYITKSAKIMHRIIIERFQTVDEKKPHVDHKNHTTWDNRRQNLRWVSRSENMGNKHYKTLRTPRLGVRHYNKGFSFVAYYKKLSKQFKYDVHCEQSTQEAWRKAVQKRIEWEKNSPTTHANNHQYLQESEIDVKWLKKQHEKVKVVMAERRVQKRKQPPCE